LLRDVLSNPGVSISLSGFSETVAWENLNAVVQSPDPGEPRGFFSSESELINLEKKEMAWI
jgi:hypothetical protein